jgi:hypothetical protein
MDKSVPAVGEPMPHRALESLSPNTPGGQRQRPQSPVRGGSEWPDSSPPLAHAEEVAAYTVDWR